MSDLSHALIMIGNWLTADDDRKITIDYDPEGFSTVQGPPMVRVKVNKRIGRSLKGAFGETLDKALIELGLEIQKAGEG